MNKTLIDTNIYSDAMRGEPFAVHSLQQAEIILLSPVVIGEILTGFRLGNKELNNRSVFEEFQYSDRVKIIDISATTSEFYSHLVLQLKSKGTPIPSNDIWIAASCMEHGAGLISRDKHFDHIEGLLRIK